jgi:hypothetical protein
MTTSDRHKPRHVQPPLRQQRAGLWASTVSAVMVAAALAGCDADSAGQPFPDFEGVWSIDIDQSSLSCPQTKAIGNDGVVPFTPWAAMPLPNVTTGTVTLEAGVLTDLVETHGLCAFNFNVAKNETSATVPNPDPYTGGAAACTIPVSFVSDTAFAPTPALNQFLGDGSRVTLTPGPEQLSFQLLPPEKGKAPAAQILGSAAASLMLVDSNMILQTLPPCTFSAQVKLHKIGKP